MQFDVSVIIPTHGRPEHLLRAVRSALASATARHVEVVVVDDNPPGSPARAETWAALAPLADDPRLRCVQHLVNRHGGAARNTGVSAAAAPLLAFLDDDDVFAEDKLDRQLAAMEQRGAAFCYNRTRYLRAGMPVAETRYRAEGLLVEDVLTGASEFNTSTIVIDRALFETAGGFDESLRRNQDLDFYERVFATGAGIVCVDAPLTDVHTDSNAHQLPWPEYESTRLAFLDRWSALLPDEAARGRARAAVDADLCWYALKRRHPLPALRRLLRGVPKRAFRRSLVARLVRYLEVNGHFGRRAETPSAAPPDGEPPPFSVLLSVYARESAAYLDACLASLAGQTLAADEIVVVEDGPLPDALHEVLARWRERLPIVSVQLAENVGLGRALSAGLARCSHDVVARMDADDIALPHRFARQLPLFADPSLAICGGWIREVDPERGTGLGVRRTPADALAIRRACERRNPFNHMTVVFRRAEVDAAGGYLDMPWMEDWYLWCRMLARGARGANVPEVVVDARTGADMVGRRAGAAYARSEWRMAAERVRLGLSDPLTSTAVFLVRALPRFLPRGLLARFYRASRGA